MTTSLDTDTISSLLSSMSSTEIISTLSTLASSGYNISQFDIPEIISSLNITQVEGLLSSNSTVVSSLLQSLQPTQLVTILYDFQNVTATLFQTAASSNNTTTATYALTHGKTLVSLLLSAISNVFTDSQLLGVFKILTNGAAYGTGSKKLLAIAKKLISGFFGGVDTGVSVEIPSRLLVLVRDYQPAIFGGHPTSTDVAPSAIFMVIFIIFAFIHSWLFVKNYSLGHKFLVSLGLAIYSISRFLGFLLRLVWAKDSLKLDVGITSTIFIVIPTVMLPSLNLILAQRYFTWKHPVYGSHKYFTTLMYLIYAFVLAIIVMTIIAACVQTDYLLSEHSFNITKNVIKASSFLIIVYSLTASALVGLAFIVPSTKQDKKVSTFQPYWIKSFSWNYFVEKGIAQKEIANVNEEQKQAISVINSTVYHHESINIQTTEQTTEEVTKETPKNSTKELDHSTSIVIITLTTIALFISDTFRCASTFLGELEKDHSWIYDPVVMYVMFGALETFVNILYILGRIDLRFYRPDAFGKTLATKKEDEVSTAETNEDEKTSAPESV